MQKRQPKQCKVKENIMGNPINPPRPRPRRPQSPPEPKPLPNRTATNVVMGPRGPKKMKDGGALKKPTADQKGLKKLPTNVRNNMGFMKAGGMTKGGMKGGGMMNTKGYAKGGMSTKGGAKKTTGKGKVRGAGIAKRGVRPAKMR